MVDCLFCKIIKGDIPGEILLKDDIVTAFRDINPVAPTHILIVPNKHIESINQLAEDDSFTAGHMLLTARKLAESEGIAEDGYRLIINTGPDGGQVIYHIHLHLIGGKPMEHPMG